MNILAYSKRKAFLLVLAMGLLVLVLVQFSLDGIVYAHQFATPKAMPNMVMIPAECDDQYMKERLSANRHIDLPENIYIKSVRFEKQIIVSNTSLSHYQDVFRILNEHLEKARCDAYKSLVSSQHPIKRLLAYNNSREVQLQFIENDKNYFDHVRNYSEISTVSVYWNRLQLASHRKYSNFAGSYPDWRVTARVCTLIPRKHKVIIKPCMERIGETAESSLKLNNRGVIADPALPSIYIHVITKAVVNSRGYVSIDGADILSKQCLMAPFLSPPNSRNSGGSSYKFKHYLIKKIREDNYTDCYDEVFIISQEFGLAYFHFIIENLPRLFPHIDFLLKHSDIKIHISRNSATPVMLLELLGIEKDRFISGFVCAKVVYLPQGSGCGSILPLHGQIGSRIFRKYVSNKLTPTPSNLIPGVLPVTKKFIFIKRTKTRHIINYDAVLKILKTLADKAELELVIFSDTDLPSHRETLTLFNTAVMVVAPHGAGLTNILFSKPGLYILEVLCGEAETVNLCYAGLASRLGHYYYGMDAIKGCDDGLLVNTTSLQSAARVMLKHYYFANLL